MIRTRKQSDWSVLSCDSCVTKWLADCAIMLSAVQKKREEKTRNDPKCHIYPLAVQKKKRRKSQGTTPNAKYIPLQEVGDYKKERKTHVSVCVYYINLARGKDFWL